MDAIYPGSVKFELGLADIPASPGSTILMVGRATESDGILAHIQHQAVHVNSQTQWNRSTHLLRVCAFDENRKAYVCFDSFQQYCDREKRIDSPYQFPSDTRNECCELSPLSSIWPPAGVYGPSLTSQNSMMTDFEIF